MKVAKRFSLARVISRMGYCSRSQAEDLIRQKRVCINGRIVTNAEMRVHPGVEEIEVDKRPLRKSNPVYLAMNKPRGLVTTASDEKGRKTVYDLLDPNGPWVAPVGRLDKASEGLLLLTNDSEWASRLADPVSHLDKVYHVQIDCVATDHILTSLERGYKVGDEILHAKKARLLRYGEKNSWLEITLDEGKNRHIRRLLQALGIDVLRLIRVSIGPLVLESLVKGQVRALTVEEKRQLDSALTSTRSSNHHARRKPVALS